MSNYEYIKGDFEDAGDWISENIMSSVIIGGRRLRNVYFESTIIADIMSQAEGEIVVGYTKFKRNAFLANFLERSVAENETKIETHLRQMKQGSVNVEIEGRTDIFYIRDANRPDDEFYIQLKIPSDMTFGITNNDLLNVAIFITASFFAMISFLFGYLWIFILMVPIWLIYSKHHSPQALQKKTDIINKLRTL